MPPAGCAVSEWAPPSTGTGAYVGHCAARDRNSDPVLNWRSLLSHRFGKHTELPPITAARHQPVAAQIGTSGVVEGPPDSDEGALRRRVSDGKSANHIVVSLLPTTDYRRMNPLHDGDYSRLLWARRLLRTRRSSGASRTLVSRGGRGPACRDADGRGDRGTGSAPRAGCALGSAGHLRIVLQGAAHAHPAERQGTLRSSLAWKASRSPSETTRRTSWRPWIEASKLTSELLGAAHTVGAGASNSRG